MTNFENGAFQPCKEWIAEQIDSGKTWEGVKAYGEDEENLNMLKDEELFPLEMTPEMWTEFVEYYRSIVVSVQIVDGEDVVAIDKGGLLLMMRLIRRALTQRILLRMKNRSVALLTK